VVRALESAASADGVVRAGDGVASGRIGRESELHVVDKILTGVHEPGDSHFELLRAFVDDAMLNQISTELAEYGYRTHEFGDSMLIERKTRVSGGDPLARFADRQLVQKSQLLARCSTGTLSA
jgi:S-adenosylmethionine:tRNA ribosyltransferase-isomerase